MWITVNRLTFNSAERLYWQKGKVQRGYSKGKLISKYLGDICLLLNTKSHSHIFPPFDWNKFILFPCGAFIRGHGEMIGPLHFRVKEREPKAEPLEVHRSLWLFIEVKVPDVFT